MVEYVTKRDNRRAIFDEVKIEEAVKRAMKDAHVTSDYLPKYIAEKVSHKLAETKKIDVSGVQDLVEEALIDSGEKDVAFSYMEYRRNRDQLRKDAMDIQKSIMRLMNKDKDVVNENANKDANVFNTQRDLTAGSVAKAYALKNLLPKDVANAHIKGEIHFHDLDYSPYQPMTNCCLVDYGSMLENGFNLGTAKVETPKSINTATAQLAQIVANVASSQYGGTSLDRLDEYMGKYARLNYDKHLADAEKWVSPDKKEEYAQEKTKKDIYDAIQSLEYNVNTLFTSNGQTPFVTVGFGLGTDWFEREVQKAILQVRIDGVGEDHHTAIFPKLVFVLKDGVNLHETDPNYDIKQLALECVAQRMYPDIVNYEKLVELTGNYKAPMGCLDYQEEIEIVSGVSDYRKSANNTTVQIGDFFNSVRDSVEKEKAETVSLDKSVYAGNEEPLISTEEDRAKFTKNYRFFYDGDSFNLWARQFAEFYGRKPTKQDFKDFVGVEWQVSEMVERGADMSLVSRWDSYLELKVCDVLHRAGLQQRFTVEECVGELDYVRNTFITSLDGSKKQIDIYFPNINTGIEVNEFATHSRDSDSEPYVIDGKAMHEDGCAGFKKGPSYSQEKKDALGAVGIKLVEVWEDEVRGGEARSIISEFIGRELKQAPELSFCEDYVAPETVSYNLLKNGVVKYVKDIDGSYVRVLSVMRNADITDWVRITTPNRSILVTSDHPLLIEAGQISAGELRVGDYIVNDEEDREYITNVENVEKTDYSYDIETETHTFVFSGVMSHNCRSFLPKWVDPNTGEEVNEGRNNLGVVTVNLPRIALESRGDMDRFWKIFNDRMEIVKKAVVYRAQRCEDAIPENAPILYKNGAFGKPVKDEEGTVKWFFRDYRATVSIGYIGLYEVGTVFYGPDWETNPEAKDFTLKVMERLNQCASELKDEYPYYFSIYGTPSESLTNRFCKLDRDKFGVVKDITDKEYYTNSFHYDIRKGVTPFEKIDFEKDYVPYSTGGFIHYCEYPVMKDNLKALEAVWDYAYDKLGYFTTNTPIDSCYVCDFEGEFDPTSDGFKCPDCGNNDPDKCDVVKRTCGYLGNPLKRPMTRGRHADITHRAKHMK